MIRPNDDRSDYARRKDRARAREAKMAAAGQEIGAIPPVADAGRKLAALRDFRRFCEIYFPDVFYLAWGHDHLRVIDKIERCVRDGGLFAHAMPRGSGKSALCRCACMWAALSGRRRFITLIAASAERAEELLEQIKTALETNELLIADFPEALHPVRALGRQVNRQHGQKFNGVPTRIEWTAAKIVLPTIPFSLASGAVLSACGMKGSHIRGQSHALPDQTVTRPDLAIIDDPQTDESAWSVDESAKRESLIAGAVLGMAGPDKKIAAVMPCTVIRPGDMADRVLDREKHPDWQGERTPLIYTFPTNEKLWDEYRRLRNEDLKANGDGKPATEFYRARQAACGHPQDVLRPCATCPRSEACMDAGAVVAWPARFVAGERSALQYAMNLRIRDEAAFFAEYQNQPLVVDTDTAHLLTSDQIAGKTNGLERLTIPEACHHLTAFVDVGKGVLFYAVVAWQEDFTGYVVDYGTFPDQRRAFFTARDARATLGRTFPKAGMEGAIRAGLDDLVGRLMITDWHRDDGALIRIGRLLIDANWGDSTLVVYQFARQTVHAAAVMPSHGRGVTAAQVPFSDYRRKVGDQVGQNWRCPSVRGRKTPRHVLYDTNAWKSFLHARLAQVHGDPGALSLWGRLPETHCLIAEHLTAESPTRTEGRGRVVDEWKVKANAFDNHWLDCLTGCCVAASMEGVRLPGDDDESGPRRRRERVRLSDMKGRR